MEKFFWVWVESLINTCNDVHWLKTNINFHKNSGSIEYFWKKKHFKFLLFCDWGGKLYWISKTLSYIVYSLNINAMIIILPSYSFAFKLVDSRFVWQVLGLKHFWECFGLFWPKRNFLFFFSNVVPIQSNFTSKTFFPWATLVWKLTKLKTLQMVLGFNRLHGKYLQIL